MNEVTTTLAIPSAIHGERIWAARRRARPRDPRRAGYSPSCVGDALRDLRRAVPSSPTDEIHNGRARRVFQHDDMPSHRMTPSEIGRLRAAKADKRRALFEVIKRDKLIAGGAAA